MKTNEQLRTSLREEFDPTTPYGYSVHALLDDYESVSAELERCRDRLQNLELELGRLRRRPRIGGAT